jgi:hypothetical protein
MPKNFESSDFEDDDEIYTHTFSERLREKYGDDEMIGFMLIDGTIDNEDLEEVGKTYDESGNEDLKTVVGSYRLDRIAEKERQDSMLLNLQLRREFEDMAIEENKTLALNFVNNELNNDAFNQVLEQFRAELKNLRGNFAFILMQAMIQKEKPSLNQELEGSISTLLERGKKSN